jgi:hypothetical protein
MTYSTTEQEAIGLCICLEAVGDVANHALLDLREVSSLPGEMEVYFHSSDHQQLFLPRLLDFANERGDSTLTGVTGSCLDVLRSASTTKSFDRNGSIDGLKKSVEELDDWLNYRGPMTLWLPTLEINATLDVSRMELLRISGNHSKHNLSRLTGVSKEVVISKNGYAVAVEQIPLALDDFREHFESNFFIYHGTWLAELMNNIRWGIQTYLEPTFRSSYRSAGAGSIAYTYDYPSEIRHDIPRQWFWRLMNNIRARPHVKKFVGAHYLKKRSSLESHE